MEKTHRPTDNALSKLGTMPDGNILFRSSLFYKDECPYDCVQEKMALNRILQSIETCFTPSVLVGTVGLWNGTFDGFRYCLDFGEFRNVVSEYDNIVIRQIGTQLHFTLIHHDGRHEMELRRFTDYGYNHLNEYHFECFDEKTLKFIKCHTEGFAEQHSLRDN
jgi:hypothetical protein